MGLTIKDIAQLSGVSYGTVSRVLNNRPGVKPETREHILKIMEQQGYQPNAIARSLVTKQSYSIAFMVPDISHPFFGGIALSVDKEAYKRGYNTVLCNTYYDLEIERKKLGFIQEKQVDGIIMKPACETVNQYSHLKIPKILVSHIDEEDTSYIDIENVAGGFMAAEHLIRCGYQKIFYIGGSKEALSVQLRIQGFKKALAAYGYSVEESLIHYGDSENTIRSGYQVMDLLIAAGQIPDAVCCYNDLIALGVMQRAEESGIVPPKQLGVIGFDDGVMASLPQIRLTTIAQPVEKIGQLATEMLIQAIGNMPENYVQKVTLRPELIVRSTTVTL